MSLLLCLVLTLTLVSCGAAATVGADSSVLGGSSHAVDAVADSENAANDSAAVLELYPDPVRDGDAGEYILLHLPESGNWSVSDGESAVRLRKHSGRVLVTPDPDIVETAGDDAAVVQGSFALANTGETVTLRRGEEQVDRVRYTETTEGERYLPASDEWRPRGLEPRAPVATGPTNATAFLLPDSPEVPLDTLRSAEDRLLIAGYTFTSDRVADALVAANERGVEVRVLVEAEPVNGASAEQARVLDRLGGAGIEVRVIGVGASRFAFHHPKYAVADDRALVLSENWKPSGVGGASSRGWGIRTENGSTADELASLFRHDADGHDTLPWSTFSDGREFESAPAANGSYPAEFTPDRVHVTNVTLLTAPGNAEGELVGSIDGADERVDVLQPSLGRQDNALVRATLRAAQRDVEVRILLSGAWYSAEENEALVTW
ncbi:MAG: phospholipase D-like domain-containing protein, partial [Halolamina sp.]